MAKKEKKTNAAARRAEKPASKPAEKKSEVKLSRKERKQQKKARLKQQLELEKQLVNEGKIPARNKYRCRNFFGRAVALCLTFLFGIVATVGAFLGFGAFAPARDVFSLMGLDYQNFISEEYGTKGLLDLMRGVLGDIGSGAFNSLDSLSKYTPMVDKYTDTLVESLSALGIHVDADALKKTEFQNLGVYFRDEVIDGVVLGEALGVTPSESNRMMVAICYGNKGVDYTIDAEGKIVPITPPVTLGQLTKDSQSVINRVNVEDAFGITAQSNAAMRFLAYGTEGLNYIINEAGEVEMLKNELTGAFFQKKTIANLTSDGATPIETAKISDLITVEGADGILGAIKDWSIADLKQGYRIERLCIDQVMTIGDDASPIAKAIKGWRLCDLTDPSKMDTLRLGDIISVDENSPPILKAIEDTQIGEIGNAVDGLRLADILEEDDIAGNNFLKSLKLSPLTSLGDDLKNLSAADVFGAEMYSYLDPTQNEDKSFYTLYKEYDETGRKDKEASDTTLPVKYEVGDGTVRPYYVHEGTRVVRGFYKSADGGYEAVAEKDVHMRKTAADEGPETVTYYTTGEQKLTPIYDWRFVDYESGEHIKKLPDGDSISSSPSVTNGCVVLEAKGEPYLDESGGEEDPRPYYYVTTRVKFENGAPTTEREYVAYPVLKDGNGIYYTYLKYTPDGGAAEFSEVRVDLEEVIVSYTYQGADVTITRNAAGKWAYTPAGEETEKVVNVYTHAEETNPETGEVIVPAYDYIKTEIEVFEGYYVAPAEGTAIGEVYGGSDVEEKFEIVKTVEDAEQTVEVERYLSGVWFFLFAEEGEGCFIDNAAGVPVLDLTDKMGGMSDTLSDTELWQLYFHGLLTKNPFVDLSAKFPDGTDIGEKTGIKNLNECTVAETISLVQQLLASAG